MTVSTMNTDAQCCKTEALWIGAHRRKGEERSIARLSSLVRPLAVVDSGLLVSVAFTRRWWRRSIMASFVAFVAIYGVVVVWVVMVVPVLCWLR
jgi:membrane protein YdbS with pleckstrin-like domain